MSDYIYKLGNLNTDYITSVFVSEGYTDFTNCNAANLVGAEGEKVVQVRERTAIKANSKNRYDFAFIPDMAFLANPDPLLKNCEIKLRFDRADAAVAVLKLQDGGSCTEIGEYRFFIITVWLLQCRRNEFFIKRKFSKWIPTYNQKR